MLNKTFIGPKNLRAGWTVIDTNQLNEDGEPIIDDVWYVAAVTIDGHEYHHRSRWSVAELGDLAQKCAERMLRRITEGGGFINLEHWAFSRITYGSRGWEAQELHSEVDEAERAGERHPLS